MLCVDYNLASAAALFVWRVALDIGWGAATSKRAALCALHKDPIVWPLWSHLCMRVRLQLSCPTAAACIVCVCVHWCTTPCVLFLLCSCGASNSGHRLAASCTMGFAAADCTTVCSALTEAIQGGASTQHPPLLHILRATVTRHTPVCCLLA